MPPPPEFVTQWLRRDETPARLFLHKLRIDVVAGADAGKRVELPGPDVKVGSAAGCDLVLADPTVSRHHATLRLEGDRIRVMDAGSTNGTAIDGLAVRDATARPDSQIALGSTVLRLAMLPELVEVPLSSHMSFGALLGRSAAMRRVFGVLERVAPTDTTVLIEGETGTGKELAAEAIHEASARAAGPFVVFDCSAITPSLVESELFGHVRGAFTGAVGDRMGAFEAADGGTVFFDEIGELPLDLQPKLLRALERREVKRVGSNQAVHPDVRIVAATNRSLQREVEQGRFREDLYHRLAVIQVLLPPLRERAEDIPLLIERFARDLGASPAALPPAFLDHVQANALPGNARELRNLVSRALALRAGGAPAAPGSETAVPAPPETPAAGGTGAAVDLSVPLRAGRDRAIDAFERAYIEAALARTGGNVSRAAELAGVSRKFIQRAMKRLGLRGAE